MADDIRTTEPRRSTEPRPTSTEDAHQAIRDTRGRIARDLDSIEARVQRQKQRVTRTTDKVRSKLEALEPARDRIRTHPWTSLGTALGAGALLGMVTGGEEKPERIGEKERKKRRRRKHERRERMEAAARPEGRRPGKTGRARHRAKPKAGGRGRAKKAGRSVLGDLGRALASGLADRAKRSGSRMLSGRR